MNTNEMQICHVNTLGNVTDLLRKLSKRDIQNGDREIVPMKPLWFYCSREDKDFVPSTFLCTRGDISVYLIKFNHLFGLHLNKICLSRRNMEPLSKTADPPQASHKFS